MKRIGIQSLLLMSLMATVVGCAPVELTDPPDSTPDTDMAVTPDMNTSQDMTDMVTPPVDMMMDMATDPFGKDNPFHDDAAAATAGEMVFSNNGCAACHVNPGTGEQQDALGNAAGNLTTTSTSDPDQEIFDTIRNGRGAMTAYNDATINDDDLWRVVTYIRTLK